MYEYGPYKKSSIKLNYNCPESEKSGTGKGSCSESSGSDQNIEDDVEEMVDVSTASLMGIKVYDQVIKENIKNILRTKSPSELDQIFGRKGEKKPDLAKMFPQAYKIPKSVADKLATKAAAKDSPVEGMTPQQKAAYNGSRSKSGSRRK